MLPIDTAAQFGAERTNAFPPSNASTFPVREYKRTSTIHSELDLT